MEDTSVLSATMVAVAHSNWSLSIWGVKQEQVHSQKDRVMDPFHAGLCYDPVYEADFLLCKMRTAAVPSKDIGEAR